MQNNTPLTHNCESTPYTRLTTVGKIFLKLLLAAVALYIAIPANAQPALSTRISTNRTLNNTNVTSKTAAHSITPSNVGWGIDSTLALINLLGIDGVLSLDDSTHRAMLIGTGTTASVVSGALIDGSYKVFNNDTPYARLGMQNNKVAALQLTDTNGINQTYLCPAPTLSHLRNFIRVPDEGATTLAAADINSTVVIHSTSSPILVGAGTIVSPTSGMQIAPSSIFIYKNISGTPTIVGGFHNPAAFSTVLELADASGLNHGTFQCPSSLSSSQSWVGPDQSGTLIVGDPKLSSGSVSGAVSVTITHGLSYTPTMIVASAQNNIAGQMLSAGWYISAIGPTTFTITWSTVVLTGSYIISWVAYH